MKNQDALVTFFFIEFLGDFKEKYTWCVFQKYGSLEEVIIHATKDNWKFRRFGFVRFSGAKELEIFGIN